MEYIAVIAGGLGEDGWDGEAHITADDFHDASEQALAAAARQGGRVISLEQSE